MFVYLSKKIAIPNCETVNCIAWNNDQGWIACGAEGGLLKVLKLESTGSSSNLTKAPASSQLSMNQTLEGHQGHLYMATWNKTHQKLTTADSYGLIIVWILYKGMWYEEMINNRNKGLVAGMQWDKNGERICIAYEDGAVILGSVDGNRIWGKEVKNTNLAHVQWSPDGFFILFATASGQLQIFDQLGTFVSKISNFCHGGTDFKISAMDWYNGSGGYLQPNMPCLAVCYEDGKVQILKDQRDQNPVRFSVDMTQISMKWNNNGSILAFSGMQVLKTKDGENKETCVIQFWTPFGQLLRSIKIPGKRIYSISWENDGLRLAATVDSFIYFANIRSDYRWAHFSKDVLVYAFNRPECSESTLTFWNTKTEEKHTQVVENLLSITAANEHCLVVSKLTDGSLQTVMTVYNSIGVPVDSKFIDFDPKFITISNTNIICATESIVFHWQLKLLVNVKMTALDALRRKDTRDRAFHIDDFENVGTGEVTYMNDELLARSRSRDPITAIAISDSLFMVARETGEILQYLIPSLTLDKKYMSTIVPVSLSINANSTRVSLIDTNGILKLLQLDNKPSLIGRGMVAASVESPSSDAQVPVGLIADFERKDVCDILWASDNFQMFSIIEKTRFYIFKDRTPEEAVMNSGFLCEFNDLSVKVVNLDELMKEYDVPSNTSISYFEAQWLREVKSIILQNGLKAGVEFALDKLSPRLWKEIATSALHSLDFEVANTAFIHCQDYQGLQFIKRLKKLDDPMKKQAEIAAFCLDFDGAEKLYLEMDRKDLALDLRTRLGEWFRVVQLIKTGGSGDDALLEKAWNKIGDFYFERQRWVQATTYYTQGRNTEKLIEVYFILEDYDNLEKIANGLSENNLLLRNIADKFLSAGLCQPAFTAYMKLGDVSSAINACVTLNQWSTAISLAETHQYKEIEQYLSKYTQQILAQNRQKDAVQLFRKANYCHKSAQLLFQMAENAAKSGQNPVNIKTFYVLGALEIERHHSIQRNTKADPNAAISTLLTVDSLASDGKGTFSMEKPWRGAEAYHFYLLAQHQFYSGQLSSAVVTAGKLREYEDIMSASTIYSLVALISLHAGYYETCSKALLKLESLEDENVEYYQNLALDIFTRYKPQDPYTGDILVCSNCMSTLKENDTTCSSCNMQFPTCIASGRPIIESIHFMCHVCKHRALEMEISSFVHCPLCHTVL